MCILRPGQRQQFPDAVVEVGFDGLQAVLREVEGGVPGEAKADQPAELIALPGSPPTRGTIT